MAEQKTKEIKISIPEELFSLLVPEKAHRHMIQAKKEMLLALRSIIDSKIEAIEKKEAKAIEKKKKIKIE